MNKNGRHSSNLQKEIKKNATNSQTKHYPGYLLHAFAKDFFFKNQLTPSFPEMSNIYL